MAAGMTRSSGNSKDIASAVAALSNLTQADLRAEWRRLYRSDPPKAISRDFLELAVAWKMQAKVLGGLSYAAQKRLQNIADNLDAGGTLAPRRARSLKAGGRLIREWHGETHTVRVTDDGYEWRGKQWRSLTAIARKITGTKWSGPRFFGLNGRSDAMAPAMETEDG